MVALLAVIQVGLLAHDRVTVTHAAREGVCIAATGGSHGEVTEAVVASGWLPPQRLKVEVVPGGSGHRVHWGIGYQNPPQQCDCARFVERIVAVATFRGLHA